MATVGVTGYEVGRPRISLKYGDWVETRTGALATFELPDQPEPWGVVLVEFERPDGSLAGFHEFSIPPGEYASDY